MRAHAAFCRNPLHPGPCAKPKSWAAHHRRSRHREAVPTTDQHHTVESVKTLSDDDVLRHTADIKAQRKGLDKNSQEHKDLLKQEHVLMREKYRRQREGRWGQESVPPKATPTKAPAKAPAKAAPAPPQTPSPAPTGTTPRPADPAVVADAQRRFDSATRIAGRRGVDNTLALAPNRALPDSPYTRGESNVSSEVASAAENYRTANYRAINQHLRQGTPITPELNREMTTLADAVNGSHLTGDAVLFRGFANGADAFGDSFNGDMTGFEYTDRGFVSTSADAGAVNNILSGATAGGTGSNTNPTRVRVLARQGTPALQLSERQLGESEMLLPPNSRFRVVRDNGVGSDGVRSLDVEVVSNTSATPSTPSAPTKATTPAPAKAVKKTQPVKKATAAPPRSTPAQAPTPTKATPRKRVGRPVNSTYRPTPSSDISQRVTALGVNPRTARDMQRVNEEFHAQYGFSFNAVERTSVGTNDTNVIAYVRNGSVLGVNARQLGNQRMFTRDGNSGWSAPGTASPQGVMVHEMGHYITENHPQYSYRSGHGQTVWMDAMAAARDAPDYPKNASLREAVSRFSRYGGTDRHESEAELFAFYHMGAERRPKWVIAWGEAYHRGHGLDPMPMSERL